MKAHSKETLFTLNPSTALEFLKSGNQRFMNNLKLNRDLLKQVNSYKDGQFPFAIILSCMDSRTTVEHIFDQGLGDVFSCRIAGNILNDDIIGSMEFACNVVGSKLILVLGHSKCGATAGACRNVKMGNLTQLLEKIEHSVYEVKQKGVSFTENEQPFIEEVTKHNVLHSLNDILSRSPILTEMYEMGKIGLAGAYYDIDTGEVTFLNELIPE